PLLLVGLGTVGVVMASTGAAVAGVGFSVWFLARRFGYHPRVQVSKEVLRRVYGFSGASYVASLLNIVPILVVPTIVINGRGTAEAGYYYLAFQMANLTYAVSFALTESLLSEGSRDNGNLGELARRSTAYLGLLAVPA